jgi:hypothetical protein
MAGPLDTGQLLLTYLFILPTLLFFLTSWLPAITAELLCQHQLWHAVRLHVRHFPRKHRKKKSIVRLPQNLHLQATGATLTWNYLALLTVIATFQFGCLIEHFLSIWSRRKKLHFRHQRNCLALKSTLAPSVTNV